jgi:hypothetical protein
MIDWAWSYWTMARYARIFLPGDGARSAHMPIEQPERNTR